MLELKNIVKEYYTQDETVRALDGVSLKFRKSEFVSILGPSGCGKTTLLNIVGGLDRYNDGDLIINGKSTKYYTDKEWDTYRNHSVGFVFQSYNLIPHQTVLENEIYNIVKNYLNEREEKEEKGSEMSDERKSVILNWLKSDTVNKAAIAYELYHAESEDEKAAVRSLFYKKLYNEKNDNGVPYEFDENELNTISSVMDRNKY